MFLIKSFCFFFLLSFIDGIILHQKLLSKTRTSINFSFKAIDGSRNADTITTARSATSKKTFDPIVAGNYIAATSVQWTLISSTLYLVQKYVFPTIEKYKSKLPNNLPSTIALLTFLFLALRSRIFSPLDNSRPSALKDDPVFKKRVLPTWMPPPLAFPIVWSTITLLRAISSYLVFKQTGTLLCPPLLSMVAHLCIGDTWNTINNIENRLGTAALGVLFVYASVLTTVYLFYQTLPLAGFVLAPSALWLTIATVLVHRIWILNMDSMGKPSYFPSKEEGSPSQWKFFRTRSERDTV